MKRTTRYLILAVAFVVMATLAAIPLLANTEEGNEVMQAAGNIPAIDLAAPQVTRTATFALG